MTNRSSLSGLLTSICHCSFVICHLLRMWGRRGGRAGQQPRERLGIPDAVEGGVYLLDLLPKNLTVRFGIELDGLCEVCYGLVAHVPLGVQDPETEVVAGLALAQGDHLPVRLYRGVIEAEFLAHNGQIRPGCGVLGIQPYRSLELSRGIFQLLPFCMNRP